MPWLPSYREPDLRAAIHSAEHWSDVLRTLGIRYHGKSIAVARKWAIEWDIATGHLVPPAVSPATRKRYSDQDLRDAVSRSRSWAEVLRALDYCPTGGNSVTVKRRCARLGVATDHFDTHAAARETRQRRRRPLASMLTERSTSTRQAVKSRLFEEGLKERRCEQCGQGEEWRGRRMGLILDHMNGVRDDHRLENLQIVCPNCAATLDTHCGRGTRRGVEVLSCEHCESPYEVRFAGQRFCSRACSARSRAAATRRVRRPPHDRLKTEVAADGYCAVGRRYGVSDNAIRKWLRAYERELGGLVVSPRRAQPPSRNALPRGERR